jgi:predicted MFS family arabinose efflux permease
VLGVFALVERSKERRGLSPLFEFGLLRHLRFRYGILTVLILTMGQFGMFFVMAVLLQEGKHLSAVDTGIWLLPAGLSVIVGAQVGARLTRRIGVVKVVRLGMIVEAVGFLVVALSIAPDVSITALLPGFICYGVGVGFAASQITNVVLSDVPAAKAGVASGTNTTARQVGAALGIAVLGSLLTAQTVRTALDQVRASKLSPALKAAASAQLHARGVNFVAPHDANPHEVEKLHKILASAVASGGRPALLFAFGVVLLGAFVSFLIPSDKRREEIPTLTPADDLEAAVIVH